ncbi:DUF3336 domain-containing protein, partial [Acinetobacter baumannii]
LNTSLLNAPRQNPRLEQLRNAREHADSYGEWREISLELDALSGMDLWKMETASGDYHHELLRERLLTLRQWQRSHNHKLLIRALREG